MSTESAIGFFFNVLACGLGYALLLALVVVGVMVVYRVLLDGGNRFLSDLGACATVSKTRRDGVAGMMRDTATRN